MHWYCHHLPRQNIGWPTSSHPLPQSWAKGTSKGDQQSGHHARTGPHGQAKPNKYNVYTLETHTTEHTWRCPRHPTQPRPHLSKWCTLYAAAKIAANNTGRPNDAPSYTHPHPKQRTPKTSTTHQPNCNGGGISSDSVSINDHHPSLSHARQNTCKCKTNQSTCFEHINNERCPLCTQNILHNRSMYTITLLKMSSTSVNPIFDLAKFIWSRDTFFGLKFSFNLCEIHVIFN